MAKKKSKIQVGFFGRYESLLRHGKELLDRYWNGERMGGRYNRVYMHYSRESIQHAMYEYALGRKITVLREFFRPLSPKLKQSEDILPLAFSLAERGKLWPSLHGTISRSIEGKRLCDLVFEVDFKASWKVAFESARSLVKFLQDFGVDFKVKFSGHTSPHIIIPAEAFPPGIGHPALMCLLDYANRYVKGRAHLDTSFRDASHFLRLAYSINEHTGRVSIPIDPERYDEFHPEKADIENVKIIKDWWGVPPDASDRTSKMLDFILEGKRIFIPKRIRKVAAKQFQRLPAQVIIAAGAKSRAEALRMLQMPYEQMLKTGQQLIQRHDELMEKSNFREAVETLKATHEKTGVMSTQEASSKYGVESAELWFLWRWLLRQDIFDYYAREDVQEAMFLHSIDRKVKLGSEDVVVDLVDPADILLLTVYIHETQGGINYPTFYCTNTRLDVTTNDLIGCDIAMKIDGKGDVDATDQMIQWLVPLLLQSGVDFAIFIGDERMKLDEARLTTPGPSQEGSLESPLLGGDLGVGSVSKEKDYSISSVEHPASSIQNPVSYIIIPSDAVPGAPGDIEGFARAIGTIERQFKDALPRSEAISVLPVGEYIPLFYSVNEISGLANVPVRLDKLDAMPKFGSLDDVHVTQDWWDTP